MRKIAERLAERDYSARTNIKQNDEIGASLARTLDILVDRSELADAESQKLEKSRAASLFNMASSCARL